MYLVVKFAAMFNSYNSSAVQKNLNLLQAFIFAIWGYLKYLMAINFHRFMAKTKTAKCMRIIVAKISQLKVQFMAMDRS